MRSHTGVLLFLAVVLGMGTVTGARATTESPPGTLLNLRVCTSTSFSRLLQRCTKDERSTVLVSNRVTCSVDVEVRRRTALRARMTYEGETIPFGQVTLAPGTYPRWINENLKINLPLPGGAWGCAFSLGSASIRASFKSGGPVGEIVNTAVCRGENTVAYGRGRVCRSDESGAPLRPTSSVRCYAAYPKATGRVAKLAILFGDRALQTTSFRVGGAIWSGWVFVTAPTGRMLAAGAYTCRYWLDNQLVTEKPFELLGP